MGRAKAPTKPSCTQKAAAPSQLVPPSVLVKPPAEPLPPVSEESADISMKEEEELCQAFSGALLTVQDVDEQDTDLPQLCSQYVKDIYNYLHVLEVNCPLGCSVCLHCFIITALICFCRWSRLYEPTTCRVMRSPNACGLCSSTGWSRFTPGSNCCRRLCTSQLPSWIVSSRSELPEEFLSEFCEQQVNLTTSCPTGAAGLSQEASAGRRNGHVGGL